MYEITRCNASRLHDSRTLATAMTFSSPDFSFAGGIWISLLPLPLSSSGSLRRMVWKCCLWVSHPL